MSRVARSSSPWTIALMVGVLGVALAGCAETKLASHAVKSAVPSEQVNPDTRGGTYKVGAPYQMAGVWYYPKEDYTYREEGVASWYGPKFHGKPTANGEIYDQNGLTAAHRTLPMPSLARVTNLANGRSVVVRINDRGPFSKRRILDCSRRCAQLLGYLNQGTAHVRVEMMADESLALKNRILGLHGRQPDPLPATPSGTVSQGTLSVPAAQPAPQPVAATASVTPQPTAARPAPQVPPQVASEITQPSPPPVVTTASPSAPPSATASARAAPPSTPRPPLRATTAAPASPPGLPQGTFIQVASFSSRGAASQVLTDLGGVASGLLAEAEVGGQTWYRVQLGPLADAAAIQAALDAARRAGYADAMIVRR
ncbi:septal ring lytic transglycosylase RlpA family protein [Roseospirillum parvum]|uniref:Endolytic peptidoglycan transglycosylase RlpA n=1 Tax=Roseospirillum parvum TaxID=83401 RepID=A0A1G7Y7Z9_9PROT|nr:septal ring lytic transglycosylase RlpA family protein [Roseospirillum parvum]SDG92436.1 rare lipoprotein A [Roseospirillum parvum]